MRLCGCPLGCAAAGAGSVVVAMCACVLQAGEGAWPQLLQAAPPLKPPLPVASCCSRLLSAFCTPYCDRTSHNNGHCHPRNCRRRQRRRRCLHAPSAGSAQGCERLCAARAAHRPHGRLWCWQDHADGCAGGQEDGGHHHRWVQLRAAGLGWQVLRRAQPASAGTRTSRCCST